MRVLITGATGFVGPHVVDAVRAVCGEGTAVIATSRTATSHPAIGDAEALDVTNPQAVEAAIVRHRPSHVIHLAGIAAPTEAAKSPEVAWNVHVQGTLNLARTILEKAHDCWLVNAGTGLVYGASAASGLPLDEGTLLAPLDDYGVTKAAADLALGALARRGLKCVRMRPFNHTGAGQTEAFVIPAFAMQIAEIEAGLKEPIIRVGNLDAERDFLDVRDVATAYALAAANSRGSEPGTILNIASGKALRIGDALAGLLSLSRVAIKVEQDPARMRPSDLPSVVGNSDKARQLLAWQPTYTIEQTLADVLLDCRKRIAR
ncbi:MAG TPA: NAD-dependent epimerase/dehydratase family protein [Rhizobiaceae bacterium]|nr:NAD-dependent epimerase/dehydratase family protein [Rhizobiaceae bacterium]